MSQFADVCDSLQCQLIEYPQQADAVISTVIELLQSVLDWGNGDIIDVLEHCAGPKHQAVFDKYIQLLK
jgi:hypothetical protein